MMESKYFTDISVTINGERRELRVRNSWTLLKLVRDVLNLTGTKRGCDTGDCCACTVLIEGKACPSCLVLAPEVDGKAVVTIEGLSVGESLDPAQELFLEEGLYQCGFCIPGMVMSTKALLSAKPNASVEDAKEALSGHICRCGTYNRIATAFAGRRSNGE